MPELTLKPLGILDTEPSPANQCCHVTRSLGSWQLLVKVDAIADSWKANSGFQDSQKSRITKSCLGNYLD